MVASSMDRLAEVFAQVTDPRKARGVRHPFPGIISLVFLGLLARITEMAVVVCWATAHWNELKGPLGFTREPSSGVRFLPSTASVLSVKVNSR